ncbi:hypothetical protein [Flammeovirga kamogawensis]|uniref:Uncharacterized protein n=1 Tax=Flammeovirga kamogawensis TaxID=373891 RepID=A0ABX8GU80_9BACT|nr:hypothetical protein [Flammeovirga kamogawensis]MBB6459871.1 myosin-crossreactive antigen [Flammeovirga kamogawensis]QWG07076.1 hypothetical protein KM029_17505 [Flammeovirga kamogawensis]TRX68897.1 hypothetical protein EO216_12495 [Flammeovirga kamogawensis]
MLHKKDIKLNTTASRRLKSCKKRVTNLFSLFSLPFYKTSHFKRNKNVLNTSKSLPYQNNGASIIALMFASFLGSLIDASRDKGDSNRSYSITTLRKHIYTFFILEKGILSVHTRAGNIPFLFSNSFIYSTLV